MIEIEELKDELHLSVGGTHKEIEPFVGGGGCCAMCTMCTVDPYPW